MKYWFDTEFVEYPCTIDLISIGIISEDNRTFYAINSECDFDLANDWVRDNVLCHLPHPWKRANSPVWHTKESIKYNILKFIGDDENPEFWAYYADYDWVVFCWLFGTMMDLPKDWPMYCRDIKQLADSLGNPELPKINSSDEHNALKDAVWAKATWEFLQSYV